MRSIFCILAVIAACYASQQEVHCEYGPSYWCSDFHAAVQCKAVKHCQQTVWSMQVAVQDRSEKCMFCEAAIGEVRKMLADKQTVDEIQSVLLRICKVIPEKTFSNKCSFVVNNDLPEFLNSLASHMDEQVACGLLGMCHSNSFKDLVRHPRQDQVVEKPQRTVVPVNIPDKSIVHKFHITNCLAKDVAAQNSNNDLCGDCTKLIDDLKETLTGKTATQDIETYMDTYICSSLGALSQECKEAVASYVPMVLSMLQGQVQSRKICDAICFCTDKSRVLTRGSRVHQDSSKRLPASNFNKVNTHSEDLAKIAAIVSKVNSAEGCLVCTTLFTELQQMDKDPATQSKVIKAVKELLCARLGQFASECSTLVDTYSSAVFEMITSELDPTARCKQFGFCLAEAQPSILIQGVPVKIETGHQEVRKTPSDTSVSVKSSKVCVLCEFVMKQVDQYISANSTKVEIEAALDKVCSIMPKTLSSECVGFLQQYGPAIIEMLEQQLDPKEICTAVGLCRSFQRKQELKQYNLVHANTVNDGQYCGVCQVVIQYLDSMLANNKTQQQIEDALEKVCNFLPTSYMKKCDDIVEKYGPGIMILLESIADPVEICTEIQLCTKQHSPSHSDDDNTVAMETLRKSKDIMSSHQLGVDKCTWGPSYWCSGQDTAEECNAVVHCQRHVWKNEV